MSQQDDDYTQIFGVGSELRGSQLLVGFVSVASYLLIFGGLLNKLEAVTLGTTYHLMLQRIYREIMMVGFCSFTFTILNQTNTKLPFGLNEAFGFADICCFAMSSFFCLQGVFIMLASIHQARNWNVASQIPSEELLLNMSVWENSRPFLWRARFLPFCSTREQVEFRILKSIFATAYSITTTHQEFDFSIFLRITHENNVLQLIDISIKNWFYIIVMTAAAALKLSLWDSRCSSESCEVHEEIFVFSTAGAVYGLLSLVACVWGRVLELRLISSAGVEGVDDYAIYLMTEYQTDQKLSQVTTSSSLAKDVIARFLDEKQASEVESKEEQYVRRQAMMKRVTDIHKLKLGKNLRETFHSIGQSASKKKCDKYSTAVSPRIEEDDVLNNEVDENDDDKEEVESIEEHDVDAAVVPCTDSATFEGSEETSAHWSDVPPGQQKRRTLRGLFGGHNSVACSAPEGSTSNSINSSTNSSGHLNNSSSNPISKPNLSKKPPRGPENALLNRGTSMIAKKKGRKLFRLRSRSSFTMNRKKAFQNAKRGASRSFERLREEGSSRWRRGVENIFSTDFSKRPKLTPEQREERFARIVKSNFGKQNFKDIFLFKNPQLFYGLLSFVITCNSLYLAWFATNFIFVILRLEGVWQQVLLCSLALLPPVVTFPTVFLAIRSSSLLKALTCLDVTVAAKVIQQSEVNTTMLDQFRQTVLRFMAEEGPGIEGMLRTCNKFAEKNSSVLRKSDFREMLLHHKVIYTPEKIDFLFGSIDLNGGSTVDYGEFETFLFSDNSYESDQKRQDIFHKMALHKVSRQRNARNTVARIMHKLEFDNFKLKKLVASGDD